jgi:hypothetical protein
MVRNGVGLPTLTETLWDTTGEAIDVFARGCADVGYGFLISFDPIGNPPEKSWAVVMHTGARFSGGSVRLGQGDTFEAAMIDCSNTPWGPGMVLEKG